MSVNAVRVQYAADTISF